MILGVTLVIHGCSSGPASLSRMIRTDDVTTYQRHLAATSGDAAAAWLAWRSEETGKSIDELARADAVLGNGADPFDRNDVWAVRRGALVFRTSCVVCHGTEANGLGPNGETLQSHKDFTNSHMRMAIALSNNWLTKWFHKVHDGSTTDRRMPDGSYAGMPAMSEQLTNEQIWLALTWLASDSKIATESDR